jgi:hypothetical protein
MPGWLRQLCTTNLSSPSKVDSGPFLVAEDCYGSWLRCFNDTWQNARVDSIVEDISNVFTTACEQQTSQDVGVTKRKLPFIILSFLYQKGTLCMRLAGKTQSQRYQLPSDSWCYFEVEQQRLRWRT